MCRVDDPLRNPNPELEKRHKRLMSYRRMWQRTWDKPTPRSSAAATKKPNLPPRKPKPPKGKPQLLPPATT